MEYMSREHSTPLRTGFQTDVFRPLRAKDRKVEHGNEPNAQRVRDAVLYHEDCLIGLRRIKNESIDFIATDPPYFLDGMGSDWSDSKLKKKKAKAIAIGGLPVGMKFDSQQGRRLQDFFGAVSKELFRVLKPGGFMVVFSQGRLMHRLAVAIEDQGFEIRDMMVWEHKGGQGKAFTQDHFVRKMKIPESDKQVIIKKLDGRKTPQLRPKFEPIILAQKPRNGTFVENWLAWKTGLIQTDFEGQQTTVFSYPKPKKTEYIDHMTVKPVGLMERLIEVFSIDGQLVLDPFAGSGTTGVAALHTGRKFIGFDIEKRYIDIAIQRLTNAPASQTRR
jgi:site-specific DNA-methyltransferase (adenine-specific)